MKGLTTSNLTYNHVTLTWTNPATGDFAGVMIRRRSGTTPPTKGSGTLVGTTDAFTTSFEDFGLEPSRTYTYGLFSFDEVPNYSVAVAKTVTTPQGRRGGARSGDRPPCHDGHDDVHQARVDEPGRRRLRRRRGSSPQGCGGAGRSDRGHARPRHRPRQRPRSPTPGWWRERRTPMRSSRTTTWGTTAPPSTLSAVTDTDDPRDVRRTGRRAVRAPSGGAGHRNETVIRPPNVGLVEQEWSLTETGVPVIAGSTLYVSGRDENGVGQLAAYELDTGDLLWRKGTDIVLRAAGARLDVHRRRLHELGSDGSIRVFRRGGSRAEVWNSTDTDSDQAFVDLLVVGDTVVARGHDRVVAYRLSDGAAALGAPLSGTSRVWDIAASGDRVLVAYDNRLRAVSLSQREPAVVAAGQCDRRRRRRRLGVHPGRRHGPPLCAGHRRPGMERDPGARRRRPVRG